MRIDIEKLLRRAAERDRAWPTSERREANWAKVRQQIGQLQARPRRPARVWALAAAIGAVLLGLAAWRDVGTEDFTLPYAGTGDLGTQSFKSRHAKFGFAMGSGDTMSIENKRLNAEEMYAKIEAGDWVFKGLFGVTLGGKTNLLAMCAIQTRFGPQVTNVPLDISVNSPVTEAFLDYLLKFNQAHFTELMRAAREGRAQQIEPVEVKAGKLTVLCKRWRYSFPDYGEVVYWEGDEQR